MKKRLILTIVAIVLLLNSSMEVFAGFITIKGKITSSNKGIENVPVTDGTNITKTDNKGNYTLETTDACKFVYYSLPSGYNSPIVDGIPVFYSKIQKNIKNQTVNFDIYQSKVSQQKHAFILWADPQVAEKNEFSLLEKVKEDTQRTINQLSATMPVHAISAGDLVFDKLDYFQDYKNVIKDLNIPFYQVIGNHDMNYNGRSNELSDDTYSNQFGPSHYSFNVGNVHYVVLKDVFYYGFSYRYIGYVDENQLTWLEKDLQSIKPGSTVIVSLHIPTTYGESQNQPDYAYLMSNEVMNKKAFYNILKPYKAHILAGHSHTQWNTQVAPEVLEHVHAAACAAWWQGEVGTDGTPKGYTVYVVDNDELTWYFKGVNMDKSEQFRAYETGVDLEMPEYFTANVYNYDRQWKVSWYEDGVYKGEMQQYWGKDPLAQATYKPGKNKKYSWITVEETRHLFKAKPEKTESQISIVVTDRFGNIYKKEFLNTIKTKVTDDNSWKLVWNDEFNYVGLPDSTKWSYDTKGNATGWGNNEAQYYTVNDSSNAWVKNGLLTIKAEKKTVKDKKYTSARLISKGKGDWLYGRFEIRAKLPTGRGSWPAIWMLSTDWQYGGWPSSGEIDIMENVGYNPDTIYGSAHTKTYNHVIGTQKTKGIYCPTSYKDFHVYALEWDENEYRLYLDNVKYFTFKNEHTGPNEYPFDKRFHLLLNLAIGGNWGGMQGIDDRLFPQRFLIDYVRVYQKK